MKLENIFIFFILPIFILASSSCQNNSISEKWANQTVDSTYLQNVLEELGSDKYMGRMPGTTAEPLTINYLKSEFQKMGIQPGNGDSYFQEVPIATITAFPESSTTFKGSKETVELQFKNDIVFSRMGFNGCS